MDPARRQLDELLGALDEALEPTADYPVIHLANAPHPDDEEPDYSSERALRRRVRDLERSRDRYRAHVTLLYFLLLSSWVVLWQNW